jgi:hypothetical protein
VIIPLITLNLTDIYAGRILSQRDFGVQGEKEFLIVSNRPSESFEATLFVKCKEKAVAKGVCENHFEAVSNLEEEVGYKHGRREAELDMRLYGRWNR